MADDVADSHWTTDPRNPPIALTVAGSDSGGGAGVQADLATMAARGVFGTSAVTALTAQNTTGVAGVHPVPPAFVADQLQAVREDFEVGATKTGMLGDRDMVERVASELAEADFPVVVDPVLVAEAGDRLLPQAAEEAVRESLLPVATLATPNVAELAALTGRAVDPLRSSEAVGSVVAAANELRSCGVDAVLVTGGHADWGADLGMDPDSVVDLLVTDDGVERFTHEWVADAPTHGSGCTLSAAITAELARGADLELAVRRGTDHVHRAVRHGRRLGTGTGPVNHAAPMQALASAPDVLCELRRLVRSLESTGPRLSRLVPEVGMNVALATPAATTPVDVAGVEGRLTRVAGGPDGSPVVRATGGVAMGASSHVARFLLAVHAFDPTVTAASNVVASDRVVEALDARWGDDVVFVDRREEPTDAAGTMDWVGTVACERCGGEPPVAVVDEGAHGKEPMVRLLADSARTLRDRVVALADAASSSTAG